MSMTDSVRTETEQKMAKSIDNLKREFSRVRTGRATPSLLEGVTVEYYGSPMQISQVASISVPEARLMIVQPWEKTMLPAIEKAIMSSDLGLNPQNDGNLIRLPIPALTEERRKELFKNCRKLSEDAKVAIRNIRRDGNDKLKKAEKAKEITQDEQKKALDDIQKLTDGFIASVDELLASKEKDIMEV
ncbi:MAG: ribosome recycling factor [Chitinivibrionales bacterium]|nr:ribosome recycling factor [Chitinivibrionales bacterium]MBD3358591.1 ribosome recycling factor [Chitinivibrionales bacterium]